MPIAGATATVNGPQDKKTDCQLPGNLKDSDGCYPPSIISDGYLSNCTSTAEICISVKAVLTEANKEVKKTHPAAEAAKEPHMEAKEVVQEAPVVVEAAPAKTVESVGVPADSLPDLKSFIPADGKMTGAAVGAMVVAVAGSGAVIKLVKSWMDGRKELAEKKLEVEEKKVEKQEEQHQKCSAERMMLETKLSAAESKLESLVSELREMSEKVEDAYAKASKAQKASLALGDDFDAEEFEAWQKKVNKALKLAAKK